MLSMRLCEPKDAWLSSCTACLSLHTYRAADPGSCQAMGRGGVNHLWVMKVYKLGRMTVKEVDPLATLPLPQQLVQKSVLKGGGAFVLLEFLMGSPCCGISWENRSFASGKNGQVSLERRLGFCLVTCIVL